MEDLTLTPFMVSISQAAKLLGLGRSKLYELIQDGDIKIVKVGNRSLVAVDELRDFVTRKLAEASSAYKNGGPK